MRTFSWLLLLYLHWDQWRRERWDPWRREHPVLFVFICVLILWAFVEIVSSLATSIWWIILPGFLLLALFYVVPRRIHKEIEALRHKELAANHDSAEDSSQDDRLKEKRDRWGPCAGELAHATFADVAGLDEEKRELQDVVEFLREEKRCLIRLREEGSANIFKHLRRWMAEKLKQFYCYLMRKLLFRENAEDQESPGQDDSETTEPSIATDFELLGGRLPRGVILEGPPGTGKTLLARAVAGEAEVPFFEMTGSGFVEMYVGVGASRVRDLFKKARKESPCVIFIDEIDALGRERGQDSSHEYDHALNELLTQIDGTVSNRGIVLIATTNRIDILDPALVRPGRFGDKKIFVAPPDVRGREEILRVHARNKPLAEDVDLSELARSTPGLVGADLEKLMNGAADAALRRVRGTDLPRIITVEDVRLSLDKVLLGEEAGRRLVTEQERRVTAYHEAGHTLCAYALKHCDSPDRVTIVPRGRALGVTQISPKEDRKMAAKAFLEDNAVMLLGGRVAEEIVIGEITSGAENDLERVTAMAEQMIERWGMGDLPPLSYRRSDGQPIPMSQALRQRIEEQESAIVMRAMERARVLLREKRHLLNALAEALLERDTLEKDEIVAIVKQG